MATLLTSVGTALAENLVETGIDMVTDKVSGLIMGNDEESNREVDKVAPVQSEPLVQKEQVTTFRDDNLISAFQPMGQPSTVSNYITKTEVNNLASLLARPQIVATGEADSTLSQLPLTPGVQQDVVNLAFTRLDFPDALFGVPLVRDKLNFFSFFKASICVKAVFNAPPFVQGKVLAVARPYYRDTDLDFARTSASGLTGYPHVEVDLSSGNSGQLKLPFVAPFHAWDLVNYSATDTTMFTYFLYVLNPIRSAVTPLSVPFTVYAWFEDVELTVPTPQTASLVPGQISSSTTTYFRRRLRKDLPEAQVMDTTPEHCHKVFLNVPAAGFNNAMGCDTAISLSLDPNERVENHDVVTDQDDMDLKYVCMRESLLSRFTFATSNAVFERLFSTPVAPNVAVSLANTPIVYFPSVLAYTSTMFAFWRGTIRYRVSVAKTSYHSGRLRLSFIPVVKNQTVPTGNALSNAYSVIWDLRESSDITVDVPFVYPLDMAPITGMTDINSTQASLSTGFFEITVLNPLRASETVFDTVSCNVWISSPDMQFAVSRRIPGIRPFLQGASRSEVPYNVDFSTISNPRFDEGSFVFRFEIVTIPNLAPNSILTFLFNTPITFDFVTSGGVNPITRSNIPGATGPGGNTFNFSVTILESEIINPGAFEPGATAASIQILGVVPANYVFGNITAQVLGQIASSNASTEAGTAMNFIPMVSDELNPYVTSEKITNFKQLIGRHTLSFEFAGVTRFYPNYFKSVIANAPEINISLLEYLSALYVFNYGSQSFKFYGVGPTPATNLFAAQTINGVVTSPPTPSILNLNSDMVTVMSGAYNNFLEFRTPHFCNAVHKVNSLKISSDLTAPEITVVGSDLNYMLRAGGEDFKFGYLVGAPAVVTVIENLPTITVDFPSVTSVNFVEIGSLLAFTTEATIPPIPTGNHTVFFSIPLSFNLVTDAGNNPIVRSSLTLSVGSTYRFTTGIDPAELVNPGAFDASGTQTSIAALGVQVAFYTNI